MSNHKQGLQGFLSTRNVIASPKPTGGRNQTADRRLAAQGLKVTSKDVAARTTTSRTTTPVQGYTTNTNANANVNADYAGARGGFVSQQQDGNAEQRHDGFDTDVGSDFDKTMTTGDFTRRSEQVDEERYMDGQGSEYGYDDQRQWHQEEPVAVQEQRYDINFPTQQHPHIHNGHHHQVHQPQPQQLLSPSKGARTGRFRGSTSLGDQQPQLQPSASFRLEEQRVHHTSKKRGHTDENPRQAQDHFHVDEEDLDSLDTASEVSRSTSSRQPEQFRDSELASTPSKTPTKRVAAFVQPEQQVNSRSKSKTEVVGRLQGVTADYSTEQLKNMTFSQLKENTWDGPTGLPEFTLPQHLEGKPLADQIEYYADKRGDDFLQQAGFYASLSGADWSEAGDHILAKIGLIFADIKKAKMEKRQVLEAIEREIEEREEQVRGKSAKFDEKLAAMRNGGEVLLKGK